jgi:hypothetical protein
MIMTDIVADKPDRPIPASAKASIRFMQTKRRPFPVWLCDPFLCFAVVMLIGVISIAIAANLIYPTDPRLDVMSPPASSTAPAYRCWSAFSRHLSASSSALRSARSPAISVASSTMFWFD